MDTNTAGTPAVSANGSARREAGDRKWPWPAVMPTTPATISAAIYQLRMTVPTVAVTSARPAARKKRRPGRPCAASHPFGSRAPPSIIAASGPSPPRR